MGTHPKHLGKYELLTRLGQGGMAEVWKAFDPQLQRMVAIKFMHANLRSDPDFMSRFVREGQAIATLHHPNIVQVYDFQVSSPEDENPMAYMVMAYIEGETLADYLHHTSYAGNIPPADEIVRLFTSLGLAVDYAHQHRIIHRDIKPANILLDARNTVHNSMGEPILTDFGIVKMLGAAAITSTGISMGTPLYISPEQVHGQPGNEKSDIYALGVILYEMCTGEPPYRGDNPYVILAQRVTGPPDPPSQRNPQISPEIDEVILRCLAMDPLKRFYSASMLTAALAEAFNISIPDVIRHVLLSSQQIIQTPDVSLSDPALPIIESTPIVLPLPQKVADAKKAELSRRKNDTVLSDTGATIVSSSGGISLRNSPVIVNETILSDTGATIVSSSGGISLRNSPAMGNETILSDTGATLASSSEERKQTGEISSDPPALPASSSAEMPQSPPMASPVAPVSHPATHPRRRWLIPISSILLLVLISVGVIRASVLWGNSHSTPPISTTSIGTITFLSSGQLDAQNIPFTNDELQIHLYHIPASGQRYYAWAQNYPGATETLFLGALQDQHGNAVLSYTDSLHHNLLAQMSSFLITEQALSSISTHPPLEKMRWQYSAILPQTPSARDHLSYLDHLRHLLVSDPVLEHLPMHHGINFWLLNNTQELYTNLLSIQATSTPQEIRQILVDLLYYLDGPCAHKELSGTDGNNMHESAVTTQNTSMSLLDCIQGTEMRGYLTGATHNLNRMVHASGVSTQQAQRATQIKNYLDTLRNWLQQMHTDTLQLIQMDDVHLKQALVTRNDLVNLGSNAISGHFDPLTQTLQPGVKEICDEITFLAQVDVSPYKIS
jgi:eukaryotic-like serine/threonine-protein kinase